MLCPLFLCAQTKDSYEYESEFTWGLNKNTFGGTVGGVFLKKGRKISPKLLETFGVELMNIKHPQEVRLTSDQGSYIYGKSNYFYSVRLQYGRDLILFRKAPQQGVEIKFVTAAGISIGFLAPYYVNVGTPEFPVYVQYNPQISTSEIQGTGHMLQGVTRSKIKPGANFKMAMNFELGTIKSQVTGFEAGFLLDAYTSGIEIVPTAKRFSLYPTLFIALFYGNRK